MTEKKCSKCGEVKVVAEFYKDRGKGDGLHCYCKSCDRASSRDWQKNNPEKERVRLKRWKTENKDRVQEHGRVYYKKNQEKKRVYAKRYRDDNPEYVRKERMRQKRYREENSGYVRAEHKRWRKANPVKVRAKDQRRRTAKKGLPATLSEKEWEATLIYFGHRCVYCGQSWKHQDHFIPLSKGGGYTRENIVPACASCNLSKSDKAPEEYCAPQIYEEVVRYFGYE